jgi:hypothetical protein
MAFARAEHTATLLPDGRVLVVGGFYDVAHRPSMTLPYAEIYDPGSGNWSPTGPMLLKRAYHTATLLPNGTVLVTGGAAYSGACPCGIVAYSELYDPARGSWELATPMAQPRGMHSATLLRDGRVLVTGGGDPARNGPTYTSTETYASPTAGPAAVARPHHTSVVLPALVGAAVPLLALAGWLWWRRRRRLVRTQRLEAWRTDAAPEREREEAGVR